MRSPWAAFSEAEQQQHAARLTVGVEVVRPCTCSHFRQLHSLRAAFILQSLRAYGKQLRPVPPSLVKSKAKEMDAARSEGLAEPGELEA